MRRGAILFVFVSSFLVNPGIDAGDPEQMIDEFTLLASDGQANDGFGRSVAISGDWAIVGTHSHGDTGPNTGSAYMFKRDGDAWIEHSMLLGADTQEGDQFGAGVDIDGDWAVAGAWYNDEGGNNKGAAYVFRLSGDTWLEHSKLQASDGQAGDWFAYSVDLDGDLAVVGAYRKAIGPGSAYVYRRVGETWIEHSKLVPSHSQDGDAFGKSVSIDDDWIVVGASDYDGTHENAGAVYLFQLVGNAWTEHAQLSATDSQAGDRSGAAVAIQGDWAIAGSWHSDHPIRVYKQVSDTWVKHTQVLASDLQAGDRFGLSMAVDDNSVIAGAPKHAANGENSGAAYVFTWPGSAPDE